MNSNQPWCHQQREVFHWKMGDCTGKIMEFERKSSSNNLCKDDPNLKPQGIFFFNLWGF